MSTDLSGLEEGNTQGSVEEHTQGTAEEINIQESGEELPLQTSIDDVDQAKLNSLTIRENRLVSLLNSSQQIQSLRTQYEEKLLQVVNQLASLTVSSLILSHI